MKKTAFYKFSWAVLVMVFLVIIAGGVVRMTQSGMGCPDWPKCFGRWIPPTSEDQLPLNYKKIYAFKYVDTSFNVYHTWVEYINRLLGMLLGLMLLVQFIWSFQFRKKRKEIVYLCGAAVILTGFQGYLGSKVVEANLEVVKITAHMLVALLIAALCVTIVNRLKEEERKVYSIKLKRIAILTIVLLLIQIILGTQVREQIDQISKAMLFEHREEWIPKLNDVFYIHRSFSLIVAALTIYLFMGYKKKRMLNGSTQLMMGSIVANILLGILMTYVNIPAIAQPLHLLFSSLLLVSLYYIIINTKGQCQPIKDINETVIRKV